MTNKRCKKYATTTSYWY